MQRPIKAIQEAFRNNELKARDLLEEAISNHNKWDKELNAYKTWDTEYARRQADIADKAFQKNKDLGPAQGIIFSIKDIYGAKGFPIFAGSPKSLPIEWEEDGQVVAEIRDQLAIIPGKTHTVEFAFGGLGTNIHWKTPRNPWDSSHHRAPGGSSSGAGVSLWEGSALIAFGTDTGGSVRVPASMTGNVGLKTTKNRWSTDLITVLSTSFDTPGILAKSVSDVAHGFSAIDPTARNLESAPINALDVGEITIGLTKDYFWERCSDDIAEVIENTLSELSAAGAKIFHTSVPEAEEAIKVSGNGAIVPSEGLAFLQDSLPDWIPTLDPNVSARLEIAKTSNTLDYIRGLNSLSNLGSSFQSRFDHFDILCVPTVPITPPRLDEIDNPEAYAKCNLLALSNTMPGNLLGVCAINIPVGLDRKGMPVGMQLIAPAAKDEKLLSIALGIENLVGTPANRLGLPPLGGNS
ncbi:MAG: amidase [Pseudomonadota bacterium]|nr:amidase [Pseudomonadota bacterium]